MYIVVIAVEAEAGARPAVAEGGELPDGAAPSDDEPAPRDDPHRALDLDLDVYVPHLLPVNTTDRGFDCH